MRYPSSGGLAVHPEQLGLRVVPFERRLTNNHPYFWYNVYKRIKIKISSLSLTKATKEDYMSITLKICKVNLCSRYATGLGMCDLHCTRFKKGQPLTNTAILRGKITHSLSQFNRPEYNSWRAMKSRCQDKKYRYYHRYGGRGIGICDRWLGDDGFKNFLKDMGQKPTHKHTLDRINNDGNYEPSNCRWATQSEQVRNSSGATTLDVGRGEELIIDILKRNNIDKITYYNRIHSSKWDRVKACTTPVMTQFRRATR